ncbi:MAG TPA: hypothetical protein VGG28_34860, partial [Kofleriaceae bacterium]
MPLSLGKPKSTAIELPERPAQRERDAPVGDAEIRLSDHELDTLPAVLYRSRPVQPERLP